MKFNEAIVKFNAWRNFSVKKNTVASYRIHLNYLCLYLHNPEIEAITYEDIIGYLKGMEDLDWDANSFMVKCIAFRKFFEFLRLQKLQVLDPQLIPIPDRDYKFPRILLEENYYKLLAVIPDDSKDPRHIRNKAIVNLFWDAGLRLGELLDINMKDINLEDMSALIKTEKAKSLHPIRRIFWTASTHENLKKWIDKRKHLENVVKHFDPDALFISVTGIKAGRRLKKSGVGEMLRRYSHEGGLPEICNPHSFRHHYGRDLAEKGANNSVISSLMGHATIQSSQVYTVLTSKRWKNNMPNLNDSDWLKALGVYGKIILQRYILPMKSNNARNQQIVKLRDQDPEAYSYGILAEIFKLTKPTVFEIYHREKAKQQKKHALPVYILKKYPNLGVRSKRKKGKSLLDFPCGSGKKYKKCHGRNF